MGFVWNPKNGEEKELIWEEILQRNQINDNGLSGITEPIYMGKKITDS